MKYSEKLKEVEGKLFIDGHLISSAKSFAVVNPATEEIIGQAAAASVEEVELAVMAARRAFDEGPWSQLDAHERSRLLYKFADLLEKHQEWLMYFEVLNNGKSVNNCRNEDLPCTLHMYRYFAGMADKIKGSTLQMSKPFIGMTRKEPIGVVALIIPWNYPLLMMAWKVAPALAAGCTVVLKPAEQTPFTALMLANLFNQAGFPPGVINIVTGFGETGEALAQHRLVNKISFTGSTEVGYLIMRNSHKFNLKPITLELGGKSANIILPDADFALAVEQACVVFGNNGQSCIAGSRTFVHASLYEKFVSACVSYAQQLVIGDPFAPNVTQGAIVCREQFDKIMYYIEEGKKEGAILETGGKRWGEKGFFIHPTVFSGVTDNMKIAREEIFGPVMSIFKWTEEEDVIKRANSLPYGLGAGVVTTNIDKAMKFIEKLKAGTIYVNCYDYTEGGTPFGGYKDSGIGKDLGEEGIEGYLLTKTIIIRSKL